MPQGEPQHHHQSFKDLASHIGSRYGNLYKLKKHLEQLTLCAVCLSVLEEIDSALEFLQHDDATLAEEALTCHDAYAELMVLEPTERRRVIASYTPELEADLCTWGVVTLLLEKARDAAPPPLAKEHAELAGLVYKRLDMPTYGRTYLFDLSARYHATLAGLELRDDELLFAEAHIVCARWMAGQGTGLAHEMVERMAIVCLESEDRQDEAEAIRQLLEAGPEAHRETLAAVHEAFRQKETAANERLWTRTRRHRRQSKESLAFDSGLLDGLI